MKMIIIIMTICLVQVSAAGLAQKVTLNEKETPLQNIIQKIRLQTGYDFIIDAKLLDKAKKVTINVNNAGLEDALDAIFKNQQLSYSITDKVVAIEPKEPTFLERLAERWAAIDVRGVVRNEKGEVLEGISVTVKGKNVGTKTNDKGEFYLPSVSEDATLVFSGVSIETYEVKIKGKKELNVNVRTKQVQLEEVKVAYNTGYQKISKERSTGSFVFVDSAMINRSPSSNIITRLDGMVPGLLFDKRDPNFLKLQIRGLYTLDEGAAQPLIVIDNFPFEGNIADINPADVENITILRDAAAASVWGARAGNGVIVITTKKGKFNQKTSVNLRTNVSVSEKQKLFDLPLIPTSDVIDLEMFLFDKGHYDDNINSPTHPSYSLVVDAMLRHRNGDITLAQRDAEINSLRGIDNRSDFLKYVYRNEVNTSYALSLSGGTNRTTNYFSLGYDNSQSGLIGNQSKRLSVNLANSYSPLDNLKINYGIAYTKTNASNNSDGSFESYKLPLYANLKNKDGKNNVVDWQYSREFTDNLDTRILDWSKRPLDDLNFNDNTDKSAAIVANLGVNYGIIKGLSLNLEYKYQNTSVVNRIYHPLESYYARDLINKFTNLNASSLNLRYPIPKGDILDLKNSESEAHSGRVSLNFNQQFGNKHQLTALLASDIIQTKRNSNSNRTYGLTDYLTSVDVDYVNLYPTFFGGQDRIPPSTSTPFTATNNRSVAFLSNFSYTYANRYVIYVSARKDAANIFGVTTNRKGSPFWSIGASWNVANENFIPADIFSSLSLRSSFGFSGNIIPSATARTTVLRNNGSSLTSLPFATLMTVPNPNLRWEKVRTYNLGVDFSFVNNRISGSVDYYRKKSTDVIYTGHFDPTAGFTQLATNSAELIGSGFDLSIQYKAIDLPVIQWVGRISMSYTTYKVSQLGIPTPPLFVSGGTLEPRSGYNPYDVVSFKWGGLNPENGDPMFMVNGQQVSIENLGQASKSDLVFSGTNLAPYFGNFFNNFSYKNFSVSGNITYRFGYVIRRPFLNYDMLFKDYQGHNQYLKRWQKPGDEKITDVPSMIYPVDGARMVLESTDVNIVSGSHIRLDNIQFSFQVPENKLKRIGIRQLQLSGQMNNLNLLLYKKTNYDIDPDFPSELKPAKSITLGLTATF